MSVNSNDYSDDEKSLNKNPLEESEDNYSEEPIS